MRNSKWVSLNTTPTAWSTGDAKVTPQKQSTETEAEVETEVVEIQIAAADNAHAREDGWPASPPPMSSGAAGGPNAGPTRKQLDAIASYADELDHVPPVPRTRAEASRLLDELRIEVDELKAETEHVRAKRLETARESGRLQGKVDGAATSRRPTRRRRWLSASRGDGDEHREGPRRPH